MPPLFIALGVAALYFLIPKSQRTAIVGITPGSGPVGINTGFAAPLLVAGTPAPITGAVTNSPGTSGSGLPSSAPPVQAVSAPQTQPPAYEFYANSGVLQPQYIPTPVATPPSNGGCGCKSKGPKGAPSSCAVSSIRSSNSGCLAPTVQSQITPEQIPALNAWVANLRSNPVASPFNTYQALMQTQQDTAPPTEDVTPSIGFADTSVGNNYRLRIRGF